MHMREIKVTAKITNHGSSKGVEFNMLSLDTRHVEEYRFEAESQARMIIGDIGEIKIVKMEDLGPIHSEMFLP